MWLCWSACVSSEQKVQKQRVPQGALGIQPHKGLQVISLVCEASCVFWGWEPCSFLSEDLPLLVPLRAGLINQFRTWKYFSDRQSFQSDLGTKCISLSISADDITRKTARD